jgi:hypothetical protein
MAASDTTITTITIKNCFQKLHEDVHCLGEMFIDPLTMADIRLFHSNLHALNNSFDEIFNKMIATIDNGQHQQLKRMLYDDRRQSVVKCMKAQDEQHQVIFVKEFLHVFLIDDLNLKRAFKTHDDVETRYNSPWKWTKSVIIEAVVSESEGGCYNFTRLESMFSTFRPTIANKRLTLKIEDFLQLCAIGIKQRLTLLAQNYSNGITHADTRDDTAIKKIYACLRTFFNTSKKEQEKERSPTKTKSKNVSHLLSMFLEYIKEIRYSETIPNNSMYVTYSENDCLENDNGVINISVNDIVVSQKRGMTLAMQPLLLRDLFTIHEDFRDAWDRLMQHTTKGGQLQFYENDQVLLEGAHQFKKAFTMLKIKSTTWTPDKVIVVCLDDSHRCRNNLCMHHLTNLLEDGWLTSDIINCYSGLLTEKYGGGSDFIILQDDFFNKLIPPKSNELSAITTTASCYVTQSRAIKCLDLCEANYEYTNVNRHLKHVDVFKEGFKYLLVPINVRNSHWCMVMADFTTHVITFVDSMGEKNEMWGCVLKKFLVDHWNQTKGGNCPSWEVEQYKVGECIQQDSVNCAVYVTSYMECFLNDLPLHHVNNDNIDMLRKRLAINLVTGRISNMDSDDNIE